MKRSVGATAQPPLLETRAHSTVDPVEHGVGLPNASEIERVCTLKYGAPSEQGWSPRRRREHGYALPADVYEATVAKHVFPGCQWIDVGGGHSVFPHNEPLARTLAAQCARVVAVDPDANVTLNDIVDERVPCLIQDYAPDRPFDLATLRMVAEHVDDPQAVVDALARLVRTGGAVIVLTVNLWAPVSIVSRLTPFGAHHRIKKLFWGGEETDTFPVRYKMNTRAALNRLFVGGGFRESGFAYVDDLSVFSNVKALNLVELKVWRVLARLRVAYPENCLLGVYRRC